MGSERRNEYRPSRVFPPGDTLWDTLEAMGMSQAELAARMGVTEKHVSAVVKGKSPLSGGHGLEAGTGAGDRCRVLAEPGASPPAALGCAGGVVTAVKGALRG